MPTWPERVKIVEVGPRDGLQNEPMSVATADKLAFIDRLAAAGLSDIEVTAFVSPKAVPQLADAGEVAAGLKPSESVTYSALVPNPKGLERALATGIRRVALFTAASETFAKRNINMTIAESLATFDPVAREARAAGATVRAYLSTAFVCPFEGEIDKLRVCEVAEQLLALGADEVSISDTIGVAAPRDVFDTLEYCLARLPRDRIALHFHDTAGRALANVAAGLQLGITTFDAAAGGLGGCPFAPGAAGNLATEDLVGMLDRMNIATGVDAAKLAEASRFIGQTIGRDLSRGKRPSAY